MNYISGHREPVKAEELEKIPIYRSVFIRMMAAVAISFLVVLLGSFLVLYHNVMDSLKERTDAEKLQSFTQLEYNIDAFCREVEFLTERLISETVLTEMVFVGDVDEVTVIQMKADYFRGLSGILAQYTYVDSICLYNSEGMALIMDSKRNIIQEDNGAGSVFYKEQLKDGEPSFGAVKWCGGYTNRDFFALERKEKEVPCLCVYRGVYWNAHRAWLVVNVNLEHFTDIYYAPEREKVQPEVTYILDGSGKIISHPDERALGEQKGEEYRKGTAEGAYTFEEDGRQILCYPLRLGGWTMVNEMPLAAILKDVGNIRQIFVITVTVAVILAVLFPVFWVRRLARPLLETVEALKDMEDGNLGIALAEGEKRLDEIGLLRRQFNRMSTRIEELVEENIQIEETKRETEMKMLKYQLNPHFLYNTLNTVKWMAAMKGEEDMVDCLSALGDILQPMYRDASPFWTLKEEEEYIVSYGKVMNYRYGEKTSLTVKVPKELSGAVIPKFILQPITENAFLYGMPEDGAGMEIQIFCQKEEDRLILTVSDNGKGMVWEDMETLKGDIRAGMETKHIGLSNVNQRIQLLYGKEYGLCIAGEKGKGIRVTVRLPLRGI